MARAMMMLLLCQLAGTVVQQAAGLPIPGPVLGLVLLLAVLVWRKGPFEDLNNTAQGLLKYFGLLFVPAGVGIVTELPLLRSNALAIGVAVIVSTSLGLAVTGVLMPVHAGAGQKCIEFRCFTSGRICKPSRCLAWR